MSIQQDTAERLHGYYDFPESVVERVSELAERQTRFDSYQGFLSSVGVVIEATNPEFIDIKPKDYDADDVVVSHLSMANPLNPHNVYGVAAIATMFPDKRVLAFGNPSGPGNNFGILSRENRRVVARGDFRPAVERVVRKLEQEDVQKVSHIGGSYGAELALAASMYDVSEVDKIVAVEPVTGKARFVGKLGLEFAASAKQLDDYVKRNGNTNYEEAFAMAEGNVGFTLGLLRATNIAISRGLSGGKLHHNAMHALDGNNAKLTIAWGTSSELCDLETIRRTTAKLVLAHTGRVGTIELPGQFHAMGNDMALMNAIVVTAFDN